jgi:hypothetical protein
LLREFGESEADEENRGNLHEIESVSGSGFEGDGLPLLSSLPVWLRSLPRMRDFFRSLFTCRFRHRVSRFLDVDLTS